jgi:hypothetical protein
MKNILALGAVKGVILFPSLVLGGPLTLGRASGPQSKDFRLTNDIPKKNRLNDTGRALSGNGQRQLGVTEQNRRITVYAPVSRCTAPRFNGVRNGAGNMTSRDSDAADLARVDKPSPSRDERGMENVADRVSRATARLYTACSEKTGLGLFSVSGSPLPAVLRTTP